MSDGVHTGTVTNTQSGSRQVRRVVHVHDSYGFGGMELYMLRLIRNLDQKRYTSAVLVPGYQDKFRSSPVRLQQEVLSAGIPLLRPSDPGHLPGLSALQEIINLAHLLRTYRPDIVHIHTCRPEGARKVTLAAWLAGVPGLLRTEHFPPSATVRPSSRFLVKPFDWLTDRVITGSEGDRKEQIRLLGRPATKVFRSHNSVELQLFDPYHDVQAAKKRLGLDPDLPTITSVGRYVTQKGHVYLLEATAQIVERYGPVNLLLVGDGELRSELEERAEQLSITPFVWFVGFKDDVIPYMQAADIAAMPSLWEVFSLAMLEFMALAKPLVTSDHSSFREALCNGVNGLIVPMHDSEALAEAILKLLRDETLRQRMGNAALERVRANFGFQRLTDDMMNLYDEVLAERDQTRIVAAGT